MEIEFQTGTLSVRCQGGDVWKEGMEDRGGRGKGEDCGYGGSSYHTLSGSVSMLCSFLAGEAGGTQAWSIESLLTLSWHLAGSLNEG